MLLRLLFQSCHALSTCVTDSHVDVFYFRDEWCVHPARTLFHSLDIREWTDRQGSRPKKIEITASTFKRTEITLLTATVSRNRFPVTFPGIAIIIFHPSSIKPTAS